MSNLNIGNAKHTDTRGRVAALEVSVRQSFLQFLSESSATLLITYGWRITPANCRQRVVSENTLAFIQRRPWT